MDRMQPPDLEPSLKWIYPRNGNDPLISTLRSAIEAGDSALVLQLAQGHES
jgi:hypothetical protein